MNHKVRSGSNYLVMGALILRLLTLCSALLPALVNAQNFTYSQWRRELKNEAKSYKEREEVKVEELPQSSLLIALYPAQISIKILNWVGAGGSLFVTLNQSSVNAAEDVISALDLSVESNDQALSLDLVGAWPFPSETEHPSSGQHYLLAPWITWRPLTFKEGSSWFKGEIPPIAIDEQGRSLAYRVRYGQGTLTLFGDGDALSDQMRNIGENRRFTQSVMWMLSSRSTKEQSEMDLIEGRDAGSTSESLGEVYFMKPGGLILSEAEEESIVYHIKELVKQLKTWWRDQSARSFSLYSYLRYTLLVLIGLSFIIFSRIAPRHLWQKKVLFRRR